MSAVVRAERLTKDFLTGFWRPRPHRALDALSFDIPAGGVYGLLGPNGAGKSTTLKLIVDLLRPTSGHAEVLGRPAGDVSARRRLGFLPEHPTFYDQLTAEELLEYFAGLFGFTREDRRRRVARVLDLVELGDARRRMIRTYSKGMVQRVGLAQALVNDPELVILDEPMSGLDPLGRREVREIILSLRDEGRTVLFSSHILSDAEMLCSRVGILARGRLVAAGSVDELTAGGGRGWEVAVSDLSADTAGRLGSRTRKLTRIADRRYTIELGPEARPEPLIAELTAAGATLVSVAPLRTTLEDVFMERVAAEPAPSAQRPAPALPAPSAQRPAPALPVPSAQSPAPGSAARIGLVALHVFKESVRDRVLYAIGGFAALLVAASVVIGQITAGQDVKIIKDLGLATIEMAGVVMTIVIGVGLVSREIERRSIHGLLAKPLPRWEFIVGKYAGLVLTVAVNVVAMTVVLFALLAWVSWTSPENVRLSWETPALDPRLLVAVALIVAELALLTAIALFFSTFSSSGLWSVVFTLGIFIAGLESQDLRHFSDIVDAPAAVTGFVSAIGWVVPAFSAFSDRKDDFVHGIAVPPGYVMSTIAYGALYVLGAMTAATAVFSRREFK